MIGYYHAQAQLKALCAGLVLTVVVAVAVLLPIAVYEPGAQVAAWVIFGILLAVGIALVLAFRHSLTFILQTGATFRSSNGTTFRSG